MFLEALGLKPGLKSLLIHHRGFCKPGSAGAAPTAISLLEPLPREGGGACAGGRWRGKQHLPILPGNVCVWVLGFSFLALLLEQDVSRAVTQDSYPGMPQAMTTVVP